MSSSSSSVTHSPNAMSTPAPLGNQHLQPPFSAPPAMAQTLVSPSSSSLTPSLTSSSTSPTSLSPPPSSTLFTPVSSSSSSSSSSSCPCSHLHPSRSCLSFIFSSFARSFYVAYGLRAGLSLAFHLIRLLRTRPSSLLQLERIVGVQGLPLDAVRLGLFMGGYAGLYNAMRCSLTRVVEMWRKWKEKHGQKDDALLQSSSSAASFPTSSSLTLSSASHPYEQHIVFLSGLTASLSVLFFDRSNHRTLALYLLARVIQCWYNHQKAHGRFHFWGSDYAHGDTVLFCICTASVMYAYVMHPKTLPHSYWSFMVNAAPIHPTILEAVRQNCRGQALDVVKVSEYVATTAAAAAAAGKVTIGGGEKENVVSLLTRLSPIGDASFPSMVPCRCLHPHTDSCLHQSAYTFIRAATKVFPIHASLTFVPLFVLRFMSVLRHPVSSLSHALFSSLRSTTFLSSLITLYMSTVCVHRNISMNDHRFVYYFAGLISPLSILLEVKSRRSELALYTLPRALDSLYQILQQKKWTASVPGGEVLLFALSMAALMWYREFHPTTMSPLLLKLINLFVPHAQGSRAENAQIERTKLQTTAAAAGKGDKSNNASDNNSSSSSSSSSSVSSPLVSPPPLHPINSSSRIGGPPYSPSAYGSEMNLGEIDEDEEEEIGEENESISSVTQSAPAVVQSGVKSAYRTTGSVTLAPVNLFVGGTNGSNGSNGQMKTSPSTNQPVPSSSSSSSSGSLSELSALRMKLQQYQQQSELIRNKLQQLESAPSSPAPSTTVGSKAQ